MLIRTNNCYGKALVSIFCLFYCKQMKRKQTQCIALHLPRLMINAYDGASDLNYQLISGKKCHIYQQYLKLVETTMNYSSLYQHFSLYSQSLCQITYNRHCTILATTKVHVDRT